MSEALRIIGDLQKVNVAPNDVLVVKLSAGEGTPKVLDIINKTLRQLFGPDQRVLIMEGNIKLEVLTPEQAGQLENIGDKGEDADTR